MTIPMLLQKHRKLLLTLLCSGLCIAFAPLSFSTDNIYGINMLFSLIFIIPVILVWETRYTLLAAAICCCALPFAAKHGYFETSSYLAVKYILLFLWLLFTNICMRHISKLKIPLILKNAYIQQLIFTAVICVVYFTAVPAMESLFSANTMTKIGISPAFLRVAFINFISTDLNMLAIGRLLLEIYWVRGIFGLYRYPYTSTDWKTILIGVICASCFLFFDLILDSVYFNTLGIHSSFVRISNGIGIKLPIVTIITAELCRNIIENRRSVIESYVRVSNSEEKLKTIFMNMNDMYIETDRFGIILDISYSVRRIFNITMENMIGVNIRSLCDDTVLFEKLEDLHNNGDLLNQKSRFFYGGKELYVILDVHKSADRSKNISYMFFAKDITELHNNEKEIRALNKQLESTVIERTDQLSKAYSDLESFSYTVSHELKTPIREIETYIEFIEEDNREVLAEQSREDIGSIRQVCTNTLHLIQSMMEYSKVGYKALNNEFFDMKAIIEECYTEIMQSVSDRKVSLEVSELPQMYGDRFLIKQLVFNIISNSVKFTRCREEALITVTAESTEDHNTFYFRDNGVGFEQNSNVHLFNIFDRMHNESDYDGSGVGLATVKKIVKRFNGKAYIEGFPDKGCCVTIRFPTNNDTKLT